jgi:hypothetical protein
MGIHSQQELIEASRAARIFTGETLNSLCQRFKINASVCSGFCQRGKRGECTHPSGPHGYCRTSFLLDQNTVDGVKNQLLKRCPRRFQEPLREELAKIGTIPAQVS